MAKDTNMVIVIGRLTRDAELKYTRSGSAISNLSIANTKTRKDGDQWVEETNFFEATLFGRQGEALNQYLLKGTQVSLTGELDYQSWEKDGQKRSKVIIKVNNIQLLGSKNNNQQSNSNNYQQSNNSYQQQGNNQGGTGNFESDIPF